MTLELRHLRVVVAIADHGSITRAARALGVAPPALSTQLRRVERMTGRQLFTRLPEGVRPTRAGEVVVQRARSTLKGVSSLTEGLDVSGGALDPTAPLLVGGISSEWFARFLAAVVDPRVDPRVGPGVGPGGGRRVEGRTNDSTTILDEWLAGGDLDAAVVGVHGYGDEEPPPGCRELTIVEHQPYLVALGRCHRLARPQGVSLADLHDTPWLLPRGHPDGTLPAFLDACRRAGFQPAAPVGPADVTFYSSWVTDQGAACLVPPTYRPAADIVVVPLHDGVTGQFRLRWDPAQVSDVEADRLAVAVATAYVAQVREVSAQAAWWDPVPNFRPTLSAAVRDRVPGLWTVPD